MIDKLDSAFRFHQEALNLRARRQEVLSANIAHADTPGFKARDFDFNSTLTQAMDTVAQMQADLRIILTLLEQSKGGWRTMMWLGGAGASMGVGVSWLISHWPIK